jgi:hypothetical protein
VTKVSRQNVEALLAEITPFLIIAGVPAKQINVAKGPNYKVNHYAKAFDWLHEFSLSREMEKLKEARALRPESVWQHYALLDLEGLQEQLILGKASQNLIKRWKQNRPRMFGPDKETEDEGTDVQSNQTDSI